jgi:hypothetical protein
MRACRGRTGWDVRWPRDLARRGACDDPSHPWAVAALVAVNLIPLAGVLLFGWRLSDLMMLYWLENGIVGGFTVLKILTSRVPAGAHGPSPGEVLVPLRHRLGAAGTAVFFSVHYGIFWTVHGVFVRLFFAPVDETLGGWWPGAGLPGGPFVGVPLVAEPIGSAVGAVGGGFFSMLLGQPLLSLVLLIALKTGVDVRAHLREHGRAARAAAAGRPPAGG